MSDWGRFRPQGSKRVLVRDCSTVPQEVERVHVPSLNRERRFTIEVEFDGEDMDPKEKMKTVVPEECPRLFNLW